MFNAIKSFIRNEEGVSAIEYGLISALVAIVLIAALTTLGGRLSNTFTTVANQLPTS